MSDLAESIDAIVRRALEPIAARLDRLLTERGPATPSGTLTLLGAAERYGVSASWLRGRIRDGVLPRLRAGRRVLVRPADIERLLGAGQANAPVDLDAAAAAILAHGRRPARGGR